jgi:hypothetical protein
VRKSFELNRYIIVHNSRNLGQKIIKGESMPVETTSTVDTPNTPQERSYHRIFSFASFVFGLLRSAGLFLFGIFLGLGIVLRDPPPDKKNLLIIEKLQQENNNLSLSLKKQEEDLKNPVFGEIKSSVLINR